MSMSNGNGSMEVHILLTLELLQLKKNIKDVKSRMRV